MKRNLILGLTLLLMVSCKNNLFEFEPSNIAEHESYIGVWTNVSGNLTRTLEVKSNGVSLYEETTRKGNLTTYISFNGNFVLKDTTLVIGFKKLIINEEPTQSEDNWYLVMDQCEFKKE